jgi:hypothetical protein
VPMRAFSENVKVLIRLKEYGSLKKKLVVC